MIQVDHLSKAFGDITAVNDVSFSAKSGSIFGLLGPNGAGKSTTISCMTGLLDPSAGRISIFGHDVVSDAIAARKIMGLVPQELALYEQLSARENLHFWGKLYGLSGSELKSRVDDVLSHIGLLDRSKEPCKQFSGGMKRRLNFGCAIVHQPKALLLDEPTVGVDPQSRERLLEMVKAEADRGTTVLYTTHYMEEAEKLCDELAIIDAGVIIAQGSLADLKSQLGERDLLTLHGVFEPARIKSKLDQQTEIELLQVSEGQVQLSMEKANQHLPEVFAILGDTGAQIDETIVRQPNLESLFIKLTGKQLRE